MHRLFLLMLVALACGRSPAAAAVPSDASAASLTAFGDEAQVQGYFQRLLDEEKKRRDAAEAERAAWLKAHPSPSSTGSTGSIAGTTVAGGTVVVERVETGFRREVLADTGGNYRVGALAAGSYRVTANGVTRIVEVVVGGKAGMSLDTVSVMGSPVALLAPGTVSTDGITNVQTAGVDEGGIVKKAGDFLVVLRRGRLFSIRADDTSLRPIANANAYAPDLSGDGTWYDEMLISGRTIIVIGYSYKRDGTEIGLFDLAADGRIRYRATYHLYSDDYFSARNYASRLVGTTLVFYSPIRLFGSGAKTASLPGLRRWKGKDEPFERILAADHVYRSRLAEDSFDQTLHTVTRCEIGDGSLQCTSTSVIGPGASEFYVSRDAVYVWMISFRDDEPATSDDRVDEASVVRMPLDGSVPTALRVQGLPIDQMSFLEKDGYLNVLVGSERKGLHLWSVGQRPGGLALLRVPIRSFGSAKTWSRPEHYRALPSGPGDEGYWDLQNRYVGNWLLYGGEDGDASAVAVRIDRKDPPVPMKLGHAVERVEAMGTDALLIGSAKGDLRFSSVALGATAQVISRFTLPGASQEDSRTHGFFYRPLAPRQGLFGLPIVEGDGKHERASVHFLRNSNLRLGSVGALAARAGGPRDDKTDGCVASCVDWYGDARPIFIGDRIYGLLGYELVEGALQGGRVRELRRTNFMPLGNRKP